MKLKVTIVAAILWACMLQGEGFKILIAAPVTTIYVKDSLCAIARALINNGHQVSMITPLVPNFAHKNLKVIKIVPKLKFLQNVNLFTLNSSILEEHTTKVLAATAEAMWEGLPMRREMGTFASFDAVVIPKFLNELIYPFLDDFDGVFLTFTTLGAEHYAVSHMHGLEVGYWFVKSLLDGPYVGSHSLTEKFILSILELSDHNFNHSKVHPSASDAIKKYDSRSIDFEEYEEKSRLRLLDGHWLLDGPLAHTPATVEVASLTARDGQPLPDSLEKFWRSNSSQGIIYVSFGSYLKSSFIPTHLKHTLLQAFSSLPHRVVWQYDGVDLDLPANIFRQKILPQQDLLGDNRTLLFISYCSASAMREAAYHGVPVLALPIALDQHKNAKKLEALGVAKILDWRTVTADQIVGAATELTTDKMFAEKMREISRVLRDEKERPGDVAAGWVEHAILHREAPRLQLPYGPEQLWVLGDRDLRMLWAATAGGLGFLLGVILTMIYVSVCRCIRRLRHKEKSE
ncbi:UDP-glucuronosyltransferase 2B16 [Hyalella azteca]|uniref:UDP-glucuronosyltransferase 2B16 n=1 Tax=Hyalella azteca TaxID=294128 RepID=A0A8B7NTU6_HYAAZ|nr:UDP-glucuronosyltransferase 2B16 [Hyalella azteca]